jgi:hypothetical protein
MAQLQLRYTAQIWGYTGGFTASGAFMSALLFPETSSTFLSSGVSFIASAPLVTFHEMNPEIQSFRHWEQKPFRKATSFSECA